MNQKVRFEELTRIVKDICMICEKPIIGSLINHEVPYHAFCEVWGHDSEHHFNFFLKFGRLPKEGTSNAQIDFDLKYVARA